MSLTKEQRLENIQRNIGKNNEWAIERFKEEGCTDAKILELISKAPRIETKNGKRTPQVLTMRPKKINLATIEPDAISWLWEDRIPLGNVTIFAGDPGIGKSLVVLDLAGRGSVGKEFVDGRPNVTGRFKTLVLAMEDDRTTIIVPRLQAMGADLNALEAVDMIELVDEADKVTEQRVICLESDIAIIRAMLEEDPEIKLIMIDPLSNYMGTKNLFRDQEIRSILIPLVQLAQEKQVAIITIMHNSKQTGRSALAKVGAALGGVGVVRIAWSFVEDGDSCLMLQMKKNLGKFSGIRYTTESVELEIKGKKTSQARLKFIEESKATIDSILSSEENAEERREKPAVALLKKLVPHAGDVAARDVQVEANTLGISHKQLTTARASLGVVSFQKHGKQGWFWKWDTGERSQAPHPADDPELNF